MKKHDYTETELKEYIFNKAGLRPNTRTWIDCPICDDEILVTINAFDGRMQAACRSYHCVKIQE